MWFSGGLVPAGRLSAGVNLAAPHTVFPRIDAAAFIYFVVQFGAATIRGRRLFEGGVYYFGQYDRAPYTASLASSPSNYVDKLVWLIQETQHNNSQRARFGKCRPQIEH